MFAMAKQENIMALALTASASIQTKNVFLAAQAATAKQLIHLAAIISGIKKL
jgi:hypothetical protein